MKEIILILLSGIIIYKRFLMEEISYTLFVDNSGSVGGSDHYWNEVSNILIKYAKDISRYYLWNSSC